MKRSVLIFCISIGLLSFICLSACAEPSAAPELTGCELTENGCVRISWTDPGQNGPYDLFYMAAVSEDRDDPVQQQRLLWIADTGIEARSYVFTDPIPGVPYWFILTDSAGHTVTKRMIPGEKRAWDGFSTTRLYTKCRIEENGRLLSPAAFSAAGLSSGEEDRCPGLYLRFTHDEISRSVDFSGLLAIYDPNGFPMTADADIWQIQRNTSETVRDFTSLSWYWDKILSEYGCIPTGTYVTELYLDGYYSGTGSFTVTE